LSKQLSREPRAIMGVTPFQCEVDFSPCWCRKAYLCNYALRSCYANGSEDWKKNLRSILEF
jgi:hypothetical protein